MPLSSSSASSSPSLPSSLHFLVFFWSLPVQAWLTTLPPSPPAVSAIFSRTKGRHIVAPLGDARAGTFFNPVPEDNDDDDDDDTEDKTKNSNIIDQLFSSPEGYFDSSVSEILHRRLRDPFQQQQPPPTVSIIAPPATPATAASATSGRGFGRSNSSSKDVTAAGVPAPQKFVEPKGQPFIGIGPPLNDVTNPEVDDEGYTLYADETTGKKSRVFEALVQYPCDFTLKIVGANEGLFVQEMVAVVAESCQVEATTIQHSVRKMGKWTSLTVQAPVQSAAMLYELYETVDRDPRVKFKF